MRIFNVVILSTIACLFMFCACSDDEDSSVGPDPANTNQYLTSLPEWDDFANVQDTADVPAGEIIAEMSDDQVLCTTTPYTIVQNPEEIVTFGSAPDVLYLGSLIQGDSYLDGLGTMTELPIRQRAPLTIAIAVLSGTDVTRVVQNPDAGSVQNALSDLVTEAQNGGKQLSSSIYYDYRESFSSVQAALSLGVSFKYLGSSGRGALSFEMSDTSRTVTAILKHIMFEAYIVRPQTPGDFFSDEFTQEKLDEQKALGTIGPDNLPVYVARIQYGRMLMYSMTYDASSRVMKAAASASYNGLQSVDVEIQAEVETALQNSHVTLATIGGSDTKALQLIRSGNLRDYFSTSDSISTAKPIAFALCNLADGSLAQVSEVDNYSRKVCNEAMAFCYTNETEWRNKIAELAGDGLVRDFQTTPENIVLSNEVSTAPDVNIDLGRILTFDSTATGFPFTFSIQTKESGAHITFNDHEGSPLHPAFAPLNQDRSLSIGDVDDYDDDNFQIDIPNWQNNTAVIAIGLCVGDNSAEYNEQAAIYGVNNFAQSIMKSPHCPGAHGFLGVVSTVPLVGMQFNEHSGGDDIFVRDFSFGVIEWTD